MRLFIVDDSEMVRRKLRALLSESPDVEIIGEAGLAEEAFSSLRCLKPDIVTLDIRMPGKSGIELIRPIKEMLSGVAIVMLTNFPYPRYRRECLAEGADYFLDKSTEFQKIPEILEHLRSVKTPEETRQ